MPTFQSKQDSRFVQAPMLNVSTRIRTTKQDECKKEQGKRKLDTIRNEGVLFIVIEGCGQGKDLCDQYSALVIKMPEKYTIERRWPFLKIDTVASKNDPYALCR